MTAPILVLALLLDALMGEPDWLWHRLPHPATLMGRLIAALDRWLNRPPVAKLAGIVMAVALVGFAATLGWLIHLIPDWGVLECLTVAILLAQRSLVDHVRAVADGLRSSLDHGKQAVAMIVGRDIVSMHEPDVARGAIESAAENLSDGAIAPAFWYLIGGLPGLLVYKMANTADSVVGHMTPRHRDFGWASARWDDLLNLIPARLTALLIALTSGWTDPRPVLRDAPRHRSPNAGWPESALAPVLNVSLAGPRSYGGVMTDYPWVWPEGRRDPGPDDIDAACRALWRAWAGMLALVALIALT
ncbi:adenosylcobinamide-phosphate synthase CbiB [Rhodobacteraceae bacterium HSP-20]|uniref:Cobalamin biosynthesis protein CobD n=1 Tax=Paragemmobacter amnigenus TaxID=2852097 RepID=A0ABS6J5R0_9RHOB|nr:adenosylcobinamide-phosphate synthase CbiB [Rhodobacter amnigenus]MBU9698943.1 adenosylcobinamide-phosphate synthase CbiB [Rhodobacter amnigenus]MBV4390170.1 adenosylcobinamide-phosphate synthase CbiB [Rhodobacter amnigenus]